MEDIIKIWKELGVDNAIFTFNCGGDSMGDTELEFFDSEGETINAPELVEYFENDIYSNVEFYVNSDGYYQGEEGIVKITLEDDEESFSYTKEAESEFSESIVSKTEIELPEKMINFIKENVSNINGGTDGSVVNYKRDFILTDEQEELSQEIQDFLDEETNKFCPIIDGDLEENYSYKTTDPLTIEGNKIKIEIENRYIRFCPSED